MRVLTFCIAMCLSGVPALADTALLISNSRYDAAQDLRTADDILELEAPLTALGFEVVVIENGTGEAMRAAVSEVLRADPEERIFMAIAGHWARSESDTWVMAREADGADLGSVGAHGIPLSVLTEIAGRAPGRAVVMVGLEERRIAFGPGLTRGIGPIDPPQGVTVMTARTDDLVSFARATVLQPGADLPAAVERSRAVRATGFLSPDLPFIGSRAASIAPPPSQISDEERALWSAVQELNSSGAYQAYLDQYPNGSFVDRARAELDRLNAQVVDPEEALRAAEDALSLNREARADVQRFLAILGYDPRGIDGIFGRGSRTAIAAWQQANGYEGTGYLTRPQLRLLRERGEIRAAQLAEEERRAAEEMARADDAFWQASGFGRTEESLRAYLDRFPNGRHAQEARVRLDAIEADRRAEAQEEERLVWDDVRRQDRVPAYRRYLDLYPDGLFAEFAQTRIQELTQGAGSGPVDPALAQAEAREAALNLPSVTRLLVERRLASLGLDTGRVDGTFDAASRSAIESYQAARGLNATGYLDQITIVRLLAEAIGEGVLE